LGTYCSQKKELEVIKLSLPQVINYIEWSPLNFLIYSSNILADYAEDNYLETEEKRDKNHYGGKTFLRSSKENGL
jgi:hypothetical protein